MAISRKRKPAKARASKPAVPRGPITRYLVLRRGSGELVLMTERDISGGYGFNPAAAKKDKIAPPDRSYSVPGGDRKGASLARDLRRAPAAINTRLNSLDRRIAQLQRERRALIEPAFEDGSKFDPVAVARMVAANYAKPAPNVTLSSGWIRRAGSTGTIKDALEPVFVVMPSTALAKSRATVMQGHVQCSIAAHSNREPTPGCKGCGEVKAKQAELDKQRAKERAEYEKRLAAARKLRETPAPKRLPKGTTLFAPDRERRCNPDRIGCGVHNSAWPELNEGGTNWWTSKCRAITDPTYRPKAWVIVPTTQASA